MKLKRALSHPERPPFPRLSENRARSSQLRFLLCAPAVTLSESPISPILQKSRVGESQVRRAGLLRGLPEGLRRPAGAPGA